MEMGVKGWQTWTWTKSYSWSSCCRHTQKFLENQTLLSVRFFFFFFLNQRQERSFTPTFTVLAVRPKYFQFHFNKQKKLPSLTVLIWREGSSINVDVGVYFDGRHVETTGFENGSHTTGNDAFTNTRNDSTCDQDVLHSGGESWKQQQHLGVKKKRKLLLQTPMIRHMETRATFSGCVKFPLTHRHKPLMHFVNLPDVWSKLLPRQTFYIIII